MEYVKLGNTGMKVSRICLGCMSYGDPGWRPRPLWRFQAAPSRCPPRSCQDRPVPRPPAGRAKPAVGKPAMRLWSEATAALHCRGPGCAGTCLPPRLARVGGVWSEASQSRQPPGVQP